MTLFRKLLIANRGEIARRINAVARSIGVRTVAVYSDADAALPFVREADEAVRIGAPPPKESYLSVSAILAAAKQTGADAVHPGYGFLSESAAFARDCVQAGLVFVGPPVEALERMKDKSQVRSLVEQAGVPVVPGSMGLVLDLPMALAEAERIGYPVLCKAAGGGGGIGLAVAHHEAELNKAFRSCAERAQAAFARPGVYLERYFSAPRHLEVQLLGDAHGQLVHCGERECSIQRRHQKLVEESPSTLFEGGAHQPLQQAMFDAALAAARAFGYSNAGTVEFLVADGAFYFIEMNTRLQVEHPVTELTTGIDLIGWQLRLAAGERLTLAQAEIRSTGSAIEFRICAEDPVRFFPSPGRLSTFRPPAGPGVRLDAGYEEGSVVSPHYDSLIAKLVISAASRTEALSRAEQALAEFVIEGPKTNLTLHQRIVRDPAFRQGRLDTRFLEQHAKIRQGEAA
jgi:acetyl-CoA carboxylase biotin carboxylase subunit